MTISDPTFLIWNVHFDINEIWDFSLNSCIIVTFKRPIHPKKVLMHFSTYLQVTNPPKLSNLTHHKTQGIALKH